MRRTSLAYHCEHGLSSSLPRLSTVDCVDLLPLVAAREWFYGPPKCIYVDRCESNGGQSNIAEAGDTIKVSLETNNTLDEAFVKSFVKMHAEGCNPEIHAKIVDIWPVRHAVRKPESTDDETIHSVSSRDIEIRKMFNFVTFTSVMDSVSVEIPDVPEVDNHDSDDDAVSQKRKAALLKELRKRGEKPLWRRIDR